MTVNLFGVVQYNVIYAKSEKSWQNVRKVYKSVFPVDTGRKLNVHKTFRRRPGRLLNVLCTFNLRLVSTGSLYIFFCNISFYQYFKKCFMLYIVIFRYVLYRGSRSWLFYNMGVLKNSAFKHSTSLKTRLLRRSFPVNFAKFLRTPISYNTPERLCLFYIQVFY